MSENAPFEPTPEPASQPEPEETRPARGRGGWVGGAVLILLGVIFLLQNTGMFHLQNWWALFILIPALTAFGSAWNSYRSAGGRFNAAARGSVIGGLLLTAVAAIFLFGLDWGRMWPVFLIVGGLTLLLNALIPD